MTIAVSGLYRYPLKSAPGVRMETMALDRRGPVGDRRWMVVDPVGLFITAREESRMVQLGASLLPNGGLSLEAPGQEPLTVDIPSTSPTEAQVWADRVRVRDAGDVAASWLETFLGRPCRLVFQGEEGHRQVRRPFGGPADEVSLADSFPLLLIAQASLDEFCRRLGREVGMERFRPNVVVSGTGPHEEDGWRRIRIGGMRFRVVTPCPRCQVPTINPDSAEREADVARTLARYRAAERNVWFGQNLVQEGEGAIAVSDAVEVLETGPRKPDLPLS
jgi:uncharacterized protein YcbX